MTDDTTLRKVNALLKLSGDNPNEHEAEAAAVKAQAMMLAEGITMLDVTRYDADHNVVKLEAECIAVPMDTGRRTPTWQAMLAFYVAKAMGGKAIRTPNQYFWTKAHGERGMGKMTFIGLNAEGIVDIFHYLRMMVDVNSAQAMRDRPEPLYGRKSPAEGRKYRLSWIAGAVKTLRDRLQEQYDRVEAESGNALVLVRDLVEEKVNELFPRLAYAGSGLKSYSGGAYAKGADAAGKMDLGAAKLGAPSKQIGG